MTDKIETEPPDGTILANHNVSNVLIRDDAAEQDKLGTPGRRWYSANSDGRPDPWPWSDLALGEWQRLYRQEDVDRLVADATPVLALNEKALPAWLFAVLRETEPRDDCYPCRTDGRLCLRHSADTIAAAMRAERLVVVQTPEEG